MASLSLRKFDISKTSDRRVWLLVAKRNTGKSVMCADILYHKRHIPMGILKSSTEEATGFFKRVTGIPDAYIYGEWQPQVIDNIIAKQKRASKLGKMKDCFIVLDDLAFDASIFKSKQMRELMFNGRHYGITLIITAQFLGDCPTYFRSNVDYIVVGRTPGVQDRERLYKNFFGLIPSFHAFQEVMNSCTEDYHVLILDNTVQSNKLSDCIFWYKAPFRSETVGTFKVGCPVYHAFAKKRAKRDDVLPDDDGNPKPPDQGRGKPRVIVRKLG